MLIDHFDFAGPGIPDVKRTVQRFYQLEIPRVHAPAAEDFPLRAVQRARFHFRSSHPVTPFVLMFPPGHGLTRREWLLAVFPAVI